MIEARLTWIGGIHGFPVIVAFYLLCATNVRAQTATTVVDNGPSTNRVDLAIIAEAYAANDQGKFASDVNQIVAEFFGVEPYQEYESYFNVHRVNVVSPESGCDHPPNIFRDTAFGCTYGPGFVAADTLPAFAAALSPVQRDIPVVLWNDPTYGGGGGFPAWVPADPVNVGNIVLHETGHSFAFLADEYGGNRPACGDPGYGVGRVNVTRETDITSIPWNYWIDTGTVIPTTGTAEGVPGLYEGAHYCDAGIFRPTYSSLMRALFRPFYQVNAEQIVKRIYSYVSPIEYVEPEPGTIVSASAVTLTVFPMAPATHSLEVVWRVDGQPAGSGPQFTFDPSTTSPGIHTVEVTVIDDTPFVRNDPEGLLADSESWVIDVPTATPTPTRTATRTPTRTLTHTPTRTATRTPTRTSTSTATRTPTRTLTPTPTRTATGTPTRTPTPTPCVGDCNSDYAVNVVDLQILANIATGQTPVSACLNADKDLNGNITVDEIVKVIYTALHGCPPPPGGGGAASGNVVQLAVGDDSGFENEQVSFNVTLVQGHGVVTAANFDFLYRPDVISAPQCTLQYAPTGPVPSNHLRYSSDPAPDRRRYVIIDNRVEAYPGPVIANGVILVCTATIQDNAPFGMYEHSVVDLTVSDRYGNKMLADVVQGHVEVLGGPSPTPTRTPTPTPTPKQAILWSASDLEINDLLASAGNCPHSEGAYEVAYAGFWDGKNGLARRYLVQFDLLSLGIPNGAAVASAKFKYEVLVHQPPGTPIPMTIAELSLPTTVLWDDTAGWWRSYCNYLDGSGSVFWNNPGGDYTLQDSVVWNTVDVGEKEVDITALVRRAVDGNDKVSLIMFMEGDTSATASKFVKLATKESTTNQQPKLEVKWYP